MIQFPVLANLPGPRDPPPFPILNLFNYLIYLFHVNFLNIGRGVPGPWEVSVDRELQNLNNLNLEAPSIFKLFALFNSGREFR